MDGFSYLRLPENHVHVQYQSLRQEHLHRQHHVQYQSLRQEHLHRQHHVQDQSLRQEHDVYVWVCLWLS